MIVLLAVMIVGFLVAVAFSVDIAQMHLSRTELRSATDAAAKAAAETLSRTLDVNQAVTRGQQIALENSVAGDPLILDAADFEFGRSQTDATGRFIFDNSGSPKNSVRVLGRRTQSSPSGAVTLFFGNIFGVNFFEPQLNATATYVERDVVLVVDRSGSMNDDNKFNDLRVAVDVFVQTLQSTPVQEQVGLASYSSTASIDALLTTDLDQITIAMNGLTANGYTSISRGMRSGKAIFDANVTSDFVERTMIVMTDGIHNTGAEPAGIATTLAGENVKIHTITFGADADQARMIDIASIGGGRHYHALDGAQLQAIYREIALTLSTMITE